MCFFCRNLIFTFLYVARETIWIILRLFNTIPHGGAVDNLLLIMDNLLFFYQTYYYGAFKQLTITDYNIRIYYIFWGFRIFFISCVLLSIDFVLLITTIHSTYYIFPKIWYLTKSHIIQHSALRLYLFRIYVILYILYMWY